MSQDAGKTNDPHHPHDKRIKELFKNKKAFISLLQDCLGDDFTKGIDANSLRKSPNEYILQDFKKKYADCVYEAKLKESGGKVFFLLLECQSKVEYRMGYRLLLYIVEILRHYYNNSDENERERKDFKFPVVIPLVFYTGKGKWSASLNLKEMFESYKVFGDYVLNFTYALVDAKGYTEEDMRNFGSKLLKIVMLLEQAKSFDEVSERTIKHEEEIMGLSSEEQRILRLAIKILLSQSEDTYHNLDEILYAESAETEANMLSDVIADMKNHNRNMEKKGRQEEKKEMARKMLLKNKPMSEIIEFTELTEAEIKKIANTLK
jgi:predicted transposase/invertase (TIGR01784 family)